jgi:hypothetical protein
VKSAALAKDSQSSHPLQNNNHPNRRKTAMAAQSSVFHIQLDGVTLTPAQSKALAGDIDRLVSDHLAKVDFRGDVVVTRPIWLDPGWRGIVIRDLNSGPFKNVSSISKIKGVLAELKQ